MVSSGPSAAAWALPAFLSRCAAQMAAKAPALRRTNPAIKVQTRAVSHSLPPAPRLPPKAGQEWTQPLRAALSHQGGCLLPREQEHVLFCSALSVCWALGF